MSIVTKANPRIAKEEAKHRVRGYTADAITLKADDNSLDYVEDVQECGPGVRVPMVESHSRALLASESPYGVIVHGKTWVSDKTGGGLIPIGDLDSCIFEKEEEEDEEKEEEEEEEDEEGKNINPLGELSDIKTPERTEMSIAEILSRLNTAQGQVGNSSVKPVPRQEADFKVKLTGKFGSYTGMFTDCEVTDEYIICVYNLGSSVFTPPTGEEKIELLNCCNSEKYTVYYAGVTFELSQFNSGFIVFKKDI